MKSGSLNLLETSVPVQACTGIVFLLPWDKSSQQPERNLAEITATLIEYSRQGTVHYVTTSPLDFFL
jgi:hypothetical protein